MDPRSRPPANHYPPVAYHNQTGYPPQQPHYPPPAGQNSRSLSPVTLEQLAAGIQEVLRQQHLTRAERMSHDEGVHSHLSTIEGEIDDLREDQQQIRDDHQEFKMAIEKRVNTALWWVVSLLATGFVGILFALIKGKLS